MEMNEIVLWWIRQLYVSAFDFIIFYTIAHKLIWKRIEVNKHHILLGIIHAVVSGLGFYFLDGWSARIVTNLLLVGLFKKIIKYSGWGDLLLISLFWFVIIGVIQGIVVIILGLLGANENIFFFGGQFLTAIAIFGVCQIVKCHRLFHAMRANIWLRVMLATLAIISLTAMFILNFELDFSYIFFSVVAIVFAGVGLSPFFVQLYQKVMGIISTDDLKSDLLMTAMDMLDETDADKRYMIFAEFAKMYGRDVTTGIEDKKKEEKKYAYKEKINADVQAFIQEKMTQYKVETPIGVTVICFEAYKCVDLKLTLTWLEILLDYFSNWSTNHPIYGGLYTSGDSFNLEMASECPKDEIKNVKKLFADKYFSGNSPIHKSLDELHQQVIKLGGIVELNEHYESGYDCYFLQIDIKIGKEDA